MTRKFACRTVPSTWMAQNGRRLDCGPYMSGGIEAREILKKHRTMPLRELTAGHAGGIFNGPQFVRNYVSDPDHGVPFLTTSTMLQADLSMLPLLSRKDAHSRKLSFLEVKEGMTLISCSGSVGRMVYARKDMEGTWSNQDIMKVVASRDKIPPGYLYSFLRSRFGVPVIISETDGAIIQHIEPNHIADLPVPRLGEVEEQTHALVQRAADLLTIYQANINEATRLFFESVGLKDITAAEWHSWGADVGFPTIMKGVESLRALNFNPRFLKLCARIKRGPWKPLGEICVPGTLKRGNRFNRIEADPEFGFRLIGQKDLFVLQPEGRWVAKNSVPEGGLVEEGSILVAARGTFGESELYCQSGFAWGKELRNAYSEDILRVLAEKMVMHRGALFAFMRSETAFRMLRSISVGSKLQDHHYNMLPALPIPFPPSDIQQKTHELIVEAYQSREQAVALEDQARTLVENAIEAGGRSWRR